VRGHCELAAQPDAVKRPELARGEAQGLSLKGHVRDGLPQVLQREFRVVADRPLACAAGPAFQDGTVSQQEVDERAYLRDTS
jgi:hypothetical protein